MKREGKTLEIADEKEFGLLSWKSDKNLTRQRSTWLKRKLMMTMVIVLVVGAVAMHVTTRSNEKRGEAKLGPKYYLVGKAVEQKKRECSEKLDGFRGQSKDKGKCLVPVSTDVQVRENGIAAEDARSMLNTVLCSKTAKFSDPSILGRGEKNMLLFQMKDGAMVEADLSMCHVTLVFVLTRKRSGEKKTWVGEEREKKKEERKEEVEDGADDGEKKKEEEEKQMGVVRDMTSPHWADIGCYEDGKSGARLLTHQWTDNSMTRNACRDWAARNYMRYAGVENGNECFIGHQLLYSTGKTGGCGTICGGNWFETCGGGWRIQVFRDENYVYTKVARWTHFSSIQLKNVAVASYGVMYGVKTDGSIVTKTNNNVGGWETMDGVLVNIAADTTMVVGVNSVGNGFVRHGVSHSNPKGTHWTHVGSGFLMMAVSSRYVYALKTDHTVLRQSRSTLSSSGWATNPGGGKLKQISAHGKSVAGVNINADIFTLNEDTNAWSYHACHFNALWASMSSNGDLMVISTGHDVLQWQSNLGWKRFTGSLVQMDAGYSLRVGVNAQNNVFRLDNPDIS